MLLPPVGLFSGPVAPPGVVVPAPGVLVPGVDGLPGLVVVPPGVVVPGVVVGVPLPAPDAGGTFVVPGTVVAHGAFNVELADAFGADEFGVEVAPLVLFVDPAADLEESVGRCVLELVDVPVVPTEDGVDVEPVALVLAPLPFARAVLPAVDAADPCAWLLDCVLDVVPGDVAVAPAPLAVLAELPAGVHGSGVALGEG